MGRVLTGPAPTILARIPTGANDRRRAKQTQAIRKVAWPLAPLGREIRSSQAVAELGVANLAERPWSFD